MKGDATSRPARDSRLPGGFYACASPVFVGLCPVRGSMPSRVGFARHAYERTHRPCEAKAEDDAHEEHPLAERARADGGCAEVTVVLREGPAHAEPPCVRDEAP